TAQPALVAKLTIDPALTWHGLGNVGGAAVNKHTTAVVSFLDTRCDTFFHAIEGNGWLEFAVGQLRQTFTSTCDTSVALHIVIPGRHVFIANGPVHRDTLAQVGFKVLGAQTIALAAPEQ